MKLIFGLGNPGEEYEGTRHNVGFQLLDFIAREKSVIFSSSKFKALVSSIVVNEENVLLIKPCSFMNLSGEVVLKFVSFYKISLDDILVIHDDLDMDIGRVKIVYDSSSGGHNGVKDIERCLGSKKYMRLKIGISNNKSIDTKDYVLGKFNRDEQEILLNDYKNLRFIVDDFCSMDLDKLRNKYNKR